MASARRRRRVGWICRSNIAFMAGNIRGLWPKVHEASWRALYERGYVKGLRTHSVFPKRRTIPTIFRTPYRIAWQCGMKAFKLSSSHGNISQKRGVARMRWQAILLVGDPKREMPGKRAASDSARTILDEDRGRLPAEPVPWNGSLSTRTVRPVAVAGVLGLSVNSFRACPQSCPARPLFSLSIFCFSGLRLNGSTDHQPE